MVHVPVVTMVIFRPDVVHTLVVEDEMETVNPEVAVAPEANGVVVRSFVPGFANVIHWFALLNVMVVADDETGS
jgi:hypothetical protein